MDKCETLSMLSPGKKAIIKGISPSLFIRRRLLDLGLTPGTKIVPLFISPSGDPTAFEFRGTVIAIRKEDTMLIDLEWFQLAWDF